ncbi:chemotaxis protein CheA, partial [Rhodoblastus sphagnicola]
LEVFARDEAATAPAPVVLAPPPAAAHPEPPPAKTAAGEAPADKRDHGKHEAKKTLRVDQAKIDLLMNLIGELVVSKNSLPFLAKRAEEVHGSREMSREIKDQYAVIDRLAQEMQSAIMAVRMLPVSDVFDRFPRLVRDVARRLGKEVELTVSGGDTAADKTIIEALGDPLLHIVRNSLDHGVESAEERRAAGKPPVSELTMRAYQEADSVVIEVQDDGRGIDPARIRAAAIEKGVITAERGTAMTDVECVNLIFAPGFSTVSQVSDLSGRGVGMDVVRTTIEGFGGRVQVSSTPGKGALTRLTLPLSMAVTRIMIIEGAGGQYGVPMDMIVETVRIDKSRIHRVKQSETFILREQLVPLTRLADLLGEPALDKDYDAPEAVLVCRIDGRLVGVVIDDFRIGMDVVLKPLEGIVASSRGFSGTTLLGDGRVLLVLDLKELL